ncbi:hypothetical protein PRIPAC_83617 [Pristionchus pacificus]|uniref:Lipocalin domain-containing protein n=1 Tax=Pristionchus pacificus TaxID=54126 RepID=A0A2A6CEV0_PRIPA|nr:hypothetical protein PRIPAC_83617 [Pristionchus pacificus]|eukprot:PDM76583.1 hypothetical protein PRIPAC_42949 [Pristionchus pacificus]
MMGRWMEGVTSKRSDGHKCIVHELWIYKVGPEGTDSFGNSQYEYAIVSDCNKYPVTVLVRNHEIFKQKFKKEVLRWLRDNKFKTDGIYSLVQPAYSSCYYTDSVSEIISH